ncbi:MAG: AfsR/SARP family transcriptional regulator [Actinomycetota bacterium]
MEEVDREPPEIVAALEAEDRAAFLLRGWVTPSSFPRNRRLHRPEGTSASFEILGRLDEAAPAGATLVAASVAGPVMPRLRPSPSVAADGLLVPVGFAEDGCLYLPLVESSLAVAGERSREFLVALCVYAQMRMGPEGCRVLTTEGLRAPLDAVTLAEPLGPSQEEAATAIRGLVLERWGGALSHREAALSGHNGPPPVALLFLDPETAEAAKGDLPGLAELGVGVLIWGEADAPRRAWVPGEGAQLVAGPELRPMGFAPALLSPGVMAEAALVLRRPAAPVPTGGDSAQEEAPATEAEDASALLAPTRPEGVAPRARSTADEGAVRVLCLGGVRVLLGGEPVEGGWRKKALELLALLVSRPEGLTRDKVLDALWPEDPPTKTGDRLRQCLRQLRQRLGGSRGTGVAEWVDDRLRLDETVWSDVAAFEAGLEDARGLDGAQKVSALRRALELYRGTFCDGHPYDWTLPVQERLRREFLEAAAALAEALVELGAHDEALRALDRGVEEDPFAEHLYRRAIEIEGERGRTAAASTRYEKLRRLLAEELGSEPSEESRRVYAAIAQLE